MQAHSRSHEKLGRKASAVALSLAAWLVGCTEGPDLVGGVNNPLVFPWAAQFGPPGDPEHTLGDTVAIVIDSNYDPNIQSDFSEYYDRHRENVTIEISHPLNPNGWSTEVTLRGVFQLGPSDHSWQGAVNPGAWFTVAVFDLPAVDAIPAFMADPPDYPLDTVLKVRFDGYWRRTAEFEVTGQDGRPNPLSDETVHPQLLDRLAPRRMVRLRPIRQQGTGPGFPEPLAPIAGIEFDVKYDPDCANPLVPTPSVYPTAEAAHATAIVGPASDPDGGLVTAHVVVVDPKGFTLTFLNWLIGGDLTLAGNGPLLDLQFAPVTTPEGCLFSDPNDPSFTPLTLKNLLVYGMDGQTLLGPEAEATDFFAHYILEPPEISQ